MRPIILGSFALLALASGCTAHLRPHPDVRANGAKLPLRATLVVPPELEQHVDNVGSFDSLGGSFAFDTGQTVFPAVKEVAQRVFQSVEVVPSTTQVGNSDVVVVLKNLSVVHPSGRSDDYQLRFDLRATVTKPNGVQIWDGSYNETVQGLPLAQANDALTSPVEKAIAATLSKLANDLRSKLGAPPPDAVAEAQSGAFSDFPPPPPPPPSSASSTGTSSSSSSSGASSAPSPTPSSSYSTESSSTSSSSTRTAARSSEPITLEGAPTTSARSGGGGSGGVLVGTGAGLFAAGWLAPPIILLAANAPGGSAPLGFIPVAGSLLSLFTNPFLLNDGAAVAMSIAGTVAQVGGIVLAVVGLMSGSSGGSQPVSLLHGDGWDLMPVVTANGIGVSLATH